MIPEIGHFALIIALCVAIVQGVVPLLGAQLGIRPWMALARPAAQGQLVFVLVAFICLMIAFIYNDFSVQYVAMQSNSLLPMIYRISAIWGGHEGSMLLWVFILAIWTFCVSIFSKNLPDDMVSRVIAVMGLVSVGFYLFILLTSNPFDRLLPAAADGRDLNPLLQDPGLIIHPPMLYTGYVGFSVAFAFALAALLSGRMDAAWARWSRPWTTVAWLFLTMGIALGSWWAYYELGWGGWWFWDPVENASFMPWIAGTALVHSLAVTEKRGGFKNWTVLLAITAFSFSILGTFLVRSGVLTSVHAFATDPDRGVFILGLLGITVVTSLVLFALRAPKVGVGGQFDMVSRESMLLVNNVLLVVALGVVMLGTLFPLVVDALANYGIIPEKNKISVGPPYFNLMFPIVLAPAMFLMAVGPITRWKKAELPSLMQRMKWAAAISVTMAIIVPFIMGESSIVRTLGFLAAFWIAAGVIVALTERVKKSNVEGNILVKIAALPNSFLGMCSAHFGVSVFIIGVTMVNSYQVEKDMRMEVGDTVTMAGYTFQFNGVTQVAGPNYDAHRGDVKVTKNDKVVTNLYPEKRTYKVQTMPMTEAAIDTGLTRDLYVSLGEPVSRGAWSVRVYYKPFVDWIWGGCFIMALGGLLAASDRRYRIVTRKKVAQKTKSDEAAAAINTGSEPAKGEA
ncbi:MAG: heme lyase CcmF/NrfE family subunit [Gammaproteobacteria bacterium]|nr:heme lyase CcmF/NrfE family subunit [Gammaproteobacteria bacterium]MDH5800836.1 heme lyase CcmF/NrfE family subunit [Gammaproteobacteria bacterium]